jgi:hypothetical protein
MSQSASQAAAFRKDILESGKVFTLEDDGGHPAPETAEGRRAMPFWSTRSRVEKIIATVEAYAGFRVAEWTLEEFEEELANLEDAEMLVGVNWSGSSATGYDVEPADVRGWLEALREEQA